MTFAVGGVSQNVCVAKVTPKATFLMTKRRPKKVRPGSKYAGSVSYLFLVCNASPQPRPPRRHADQPEPEEPHTHGKLPPP